jgi:hypothetical protein
LRETNVKPWLLGWCWDEICARSLRFVPAANVAGRRAADRSPAKAGGAGTNRQTVPAGYGVDEYGTVTDMGFAEIAATPSDRGYATTLE